MAVSTTWAQEPDSATSTSRSVRQKINTKGFYAPEMVAAPQITFLLGDGQIATVYKSEVVVKACVKTGQPLTSLSLYVNDELIPATRDLKVERDQPVCDQPVSQAVLLREGENRLRLVARNAAGTTSESFLIRYEKAALTAGPTEKRLALVIGNANYTGMSRLANSANDADDVAATLSKLGFDVLVKTNLDRDGINQLIDEFGEKLKEGNYDVGLFFYAGHGVQVKGQNYLVPINARPRAENEIRYQCVEADYVMAKMETGGTRTNIIILDACRNNPFESAFSRNAGEGLAPMTGPNGTFIAYATTGNQNALDGTGRNGTYTSALLQAIQTPNARIEDVFKQVRKEVSTKTKGAQRPWEYSSLSGDFYFSKK